MLQEERLLRIRSLLATFTRLGVERIAQDLDVSRETVRRDLLQLEAEGALRRVHGGAVAVSQAEPEPPLAQRMAVRQKEKRAIARAALALLQPGQTLFIDAGSTNTMLAEELATLSGMTVVTNSLPIALKLAQANQAREARNRTLLLGGEIDARTQASCGATTIGEIHRLRADLALLSPVALHPRHGAMSFEHEEAAVARAMAAQAQRTVVLADHGKLGLTSRVAWARPADIATVITDARARGLPVLAALRRAGAQVIVA